MPEIFRPCNACAAGLYEECENPTPVGQHIIPCIYQFDQPVHVTVSGERGAVKDSREVKDILSTGRKRAAMLLPIMQGQFCDWAGLKWAGGGVQPITGCRDTRLAPVKKNEDLPEGNYSRGELHHGPDKSVLNNAVGRNLHAICSSCVTGEMRLLTEDLRWVRADEIREGDRLIGFSEELGPRAIFEPAVVTSAVKVWEPSYRIYMKNGDVLTSSHAHQWVAGRPSDGHTSWFRTEQFMNRYETARSGHFTLRRFVQPWEEDNSFEAGWLSGFLDGEGSLSGDHLSVSQTLSGDNEIAAEIMEREIYKRARKVNRQESGAAGRDKAKLVLRVTTLPDIMRILGQVRPERLLAKWKRFLYEGNASRNKARKHMKRGRGIVTDGIRQEIERVEYIGETEVYSISTTAKTYIVEGYLSHNCHHRWHELNDPSFEGGRPNAAHLQWVPSQPYYNHAFVEPATEEEMEAVEAWWATDKSKRGPYPIELPPERFLLQPEEQGILTGDNPFEEPLDPFTDTENGESQ